METEAELIPIMGLMLAQVRQTRQAIQDIQRSTSNYGGYAFATAFSSGARFGAPPLLNGALMVHVVNLSDLSASSGIGGFIEGLFGGIGRLLGGLLGGIIGGTASAATLPWLMAQMNGIVDGIQRVAPVFSRIVDGVERVMRLLGMGGTSGIGPTATGPPADGQQMPSRMTDGARALTALLTAANGAPAAAADRSALPMTETGQRWLTMLRSFNDLARSLSRVVDGLIIFIVLLTGSLALLFANLGNIKLALVELLQFAIRNVLLLRGVVLVTVFDIASMAARLAGDVLAILGVAVQRILLVIFNMIGHILDGALTVINLALTTLGRTIDALLGWLVTTLVRVLTTLGDLRIFRVLVHVLNILPAMMPPLYELMRDKGRSPPLTSAQQRDLHRAARMRISAPSAPGPRIPAFSPFPNLALPPGVVSSFNSAFTTTSTRLANDSGQLVTTLGSTLTSLASRLDRAGADEARISSATLAGRYQTVQQRATDFTQALTSARDAARNQPETGLEQIARAYEGWLTGGGLNSILTRITDHFQATPPRDTRSLPATIAAQTIDRPRATVDIQDVTIEITQPPAPETATRGTLAPSALTDSVLDRIAEALRRRSRELIDRAYVPDPGTSPNHGP